MSPENWINHLKTRLDPPEGGPAKLIHSDYDLNNGAAGVAKTPRQAAVLAPLVERNGELFVVLTERQMHLPSHAGQISFPGGGLQAGDADLAAAALRETHEEIGAPPDAIELLGAWEGYETVTGFHVTPFAGRLDPDIKLTADPGEVARIFEAPFDFLMDPANHKRQWRVWNGQRRYFYAMPYDEHFIWGATAGMLKALADRIGEQGLKK